MTDARALPTWLHQDPPGSDPPRRPASRRLVKTLIVLYSVALVLIVFWPTPVDRDLGWLLQAISRRMPWLSYGAIEFGANVLLFVPFGMLLPLAWPAIRRVVVPLALAATVAIESAQAVFLAERTMSVRDVVANVLGAAIGFALAWLIERRPRRGHANMGPRG